MAELRPPVQTEGQKGNAQAVEATIGILEQIQGHCPVLQGWGQEGHGATETKLGKGYEE